ncbi:FCD domain-containing protein [Agrobacterium vitis]|uniref:FCD domain-containing protein n=1 Tax=Agrobacterium vitis TaxID=373 RepID=A0A6I4G8Y7_AGRVI|nr:GntR family transcriptional regulator [Agrobacterium vitis]MBF2714346.1 GntR family transcriptional regulator [Agrobacterium vitis]MVA22007.1 FCD domain-containing protein [Agrobacterium vitis]MVA59354.1 FCD domain-containing protein [Agrobacterium vitis]MVA82665.1 FCD domain-containing protein [Agrobacterium vitis]
MNIDVQTKAADSTPTLATSIYERLKADILSARLEPGRKLQLRFLMEYYDAGQTPLREALNRLSAEDLVIGKEQRGFFVTPISLEELGELTKTRSWVEGLALRESIAHTTPAWEESLLVAHHRLERAPRSLNPERFESNPEWERLHRAFHALLIGGCGSRPLIGFCEQLADQLQRYRALSSRKAFRVRKVSQEHADILRAVLDGNSDEAVSLLQGHYEQTAGFIKADLETGETGDIKSPA